MSVLNQSGEEQECPLCLEALEVDDLHFYPCTCGYQICRFCWNRIRETENGLCPACRKAYPENPADFTPLSQEQVAAIKTEKKAREQRRRNKTLESRRQLANVRVVQNNLVFVVGLPVRLADPEILKRPEYFGKYGKIHKVVINQSTTYAGSQQGPSASAYVTYVSQADALRAIQSVNNVTIDGRVLKGSLGTTKYCANFMKNQPCPKTDCMYLHELGDPNASFSKEEMHLGMHQVYERKLHEKSLAQQAAAAGTTTNGEKNSSKDKSPPGFMPTAMVTSSNINIVNCNSKSSKKDGSSVSPCGGKEAWPSLGCSPPASDSSGSKQPSPKPDSNPHSDCTSTSQESGSSESCSPTQSQAKHKDSKHRREQKHKGTEHKWKKSNNNNNNSSSVNEGSDDEVASKEEGVAGEADTEESERHSLIDNHSLIDDHGLIDSHDLLDDDHALLDDDRGLHSLLGDSSSDAALMQRHRELLASLVDNNDMVARSKPVDSYGLLDGYERDAPERSRAELLRTGEQFARLPRVALDSHLLGTNYPAATASMLPPFGVRMDGAYGAGGARLPPAAPHPAPHHNGYAEAEGRYLGDNMDKFFTDFHKTQQLKYLLGKAGDCGNGACGSGFPDSRLKFGHLPPPANIMSAHQLEMEQKQRHQELLAAQNSALHNSVLQNSVLQNTVLQNSVLQNSVLQNSLQNQLQNQLQNTALQNQLQNTALQNSVLQNSALHNAALQNTVLQSSMLQNSAMQSAALQNSMPHSLHSGLPSHMGSGSLHQRPTTVDDDLDFDPFKETQKAFAEMMVENELLENGLNPNESAERLRRARLPPPGFTHMNSFGMGLPRHAHTQQDWTQMDPAIMSTSVSFAKPPQPDLLQRFSHLELERKPWGAFPPAERAPAYSVPLPPGFAERAPPNPAAECIESK